jgi:diguanylate cyclase (GGDEF)-like protein/PAS domain S-box-containing protein
VKDTEKTKEQLISELADLSKHASEQEAKLKELRESEERYRSLIDNAQEAIVVAQDGMMKFFNSKTAEITGYPPGELTAIPFLDVIHPDDRQMVLDRHLRRLKGEEFPHVYSVRIIRKDGAIKWLELNAVLISWNGNPATLNLLSDVTERTNTEEALRQSEEKLRLTFEAIEDSIIIIDPEGRVLEANESAIRLAGFKNRPQVIGINAFDIISPKDRERVMKAFRERLAGHSQRNTECAIRQKRGKKEVVVDITASPLRDAAGHSIGYIAVLRDITERKRIQDALQESEEKLRLTFESIKENVSISDLEGHIVMINEAGLRMSGYDRREELIGRNGMDFIAEKDRERAIEDMTRQLHEGRGSAFSHCTMTDKNGNEYYGEISAAMLPDAGGNPVGFIAVVRDITERKLMEQALLESGEKLSLIFESIKDGITLIDLEGNIVDVNEATVRMSGYSHKEELIGRSSLEFIAEKYRAHAIEDMTRQISEGRGSDLSYYGLIDKNGNEYDGEVSATILPDANGNPAGFIAVVRDISERKRMEKALHESGEKLQLTLESIEDGIIVIDTDGNVLDANEATVRMGGYQNKSQLIGRNAFEWIAPKDRSLVMDDLKARLEGHPKEKMEYSVHPKNGRDFEVELTASTLRDEEGNPAGYIAVLRDVTKRKASEEKLRESEKKYKDLVEQEKDVIFAIDVNGCFTTMNSAVATWGYKQSDLIGQHYSKCIPPDVMKKLEDDLSKPLLSSGEIVAEAVGIDSEGKRRSIEFSAMVILENGKFDGVRGIVRDITERKRAEEALKQRNRELATLNKIAEAVSHPLGLNKVLRTALDSVLETMNFAGGSIWLVDPESSELRLVASKGAKDMLTAGSALSKAVETGEAASTVYNDKSGRSKKAPTQDDYEGKSIVSVPLRSKGETLGALGVVGMNAFSLDDMRLLETVGDQIAVAVENAQLLDKLNELSITDELTGLFNRRHFYEVLGEEIDRTRRYGRCISLAMIDLDGFKKYNDKFGHASGDVILADFAKILTETLRKTDTAFRYGGDEFIVIFPATNAERAKEVIERISKKWLKRLAAQLPLADIQLGFSAGIAQFPDNAETVDGLVFLSDTALYYAKRGGKQKVMLISDLGTSSLDVLSASTLDQVYALAATVDTRDPYTYGHSKRTAAIAESIGKAIGLGSDDLSDLTAAAFLHDIGKVGIADIILTKPGKPKKEEWEAIKKHCAEGAKIVQHVKELLPLAPVILHHHEWYDGTGYPDGLKGEEIPLHARIISVADAYDTMTAKRPYHEGVSPQKALEELERCSGTQFDPQLIEALRRITGNGSQVAHY